MKKKIVIHLFALALSINCFSQAEEKTELVMNAFLNYNFSPKQDLKSLTPILNFGWEKEWLNHKKPFSYTLGVNPYAASTITIPDSASFLPALMLPGNIGLTVNNHFKYDFDNGKQSIIFMPLDLGFKIISNFKDSGTSITQHNLRMGFAYQLKDFLSINVQHAWAWHNLTSESEKKYKELFPGMPNELQYWSITLQSKFNISVDNPVYVALSWKSISNYSGFNQYPNNKILSIGFYKNFNFQNGGAKRAERASPKENLNYTRTTNVF